MKDLWKSLMRRKQRDAEPEEPAVADDARAPSGVADESAEGSRAGALPAQGGHASPHRGATQADATSHAASFTGAAGQSSGVPSAGDTGGGTSNQASGAGGSLRLAEGQSWLSVPIPAGAGAWLVAWLLHRQLLPATELAPDERALLARLDAALRSEHARKALLPRAPQVVPQLLAALRTDNVSAASLAERIERDSVLHAEVLRRVNSASFAVRNEVTELRQAITILGTSELRALIAHHALRPIFDAPAGSLAAAVAPRIAALGERKSQICGAIAVDEGLDAFDGYLSGLVHDIGWSAIARVFDREAEDTPERDRERARGPLTSAFADALLARRDALFGLVVRPWGLTPGVTTLATWMAEQLPGQAQAPAARAAAAVAAEPSPLEPILRWGETLASLPVLKTMPALPPLPQSIREAIRRAPALPG